MLPGDNVWGQLEAGRRRLCRGRDEALLLSLELGVTVPLLQVEEVLEGRGQAGHGLLLFT